MPVIRLAALLTHYSDVELEKIVRENVDEHMNLAEKFVAAFKPKEQEVQLLNMGYARLQIVLERIVGKDAMDATGGKPAPVEKLAP